jgi:hypothetical protein
MAEEKVERERIPFWQILFDDPFFLLVLGLGLPLVLYLIWGVVEMTTIPSFTP